MNTEQDGIKTDLRAHPDIFRDGNPENTDDSNLVNDHGAKSAHTEVPSQHSKLS